MTDIDFGTFTLDDRTLRGWLVPFHERSALSASGHRGYFTPDTINLPRDPSVVTLNREHDRHDPIGRASLLEAREQGVYAEFTLADTDEADQWRADQSSTLRRLSPEVLYAADKVHAKLTGAALVEQGAFASAGLFAIHTDEESAPETPDEETPESANNKEEIVTEVAILPEGVPSPAVENTDDATASGLFAAMQRVAHGDTAEAARINGQNALFAISPIQHSGPSAVTIGADVQETGYLGELWSGNAYQRKYAQLFTQRSLTNFTVSGWKWATGPVVASYAGNNAEIPSAAVDTTPVTATAQRIAGGHRLDRRFLDFNDQGVIESYFRKMSESYAKVSDAAFLAAAVTGAGAATDITPVSGVNNTLVGIIQGALGLIAADVTPTFAVVDPTVYASLLYEVDDDKLSNLGYKFGLTGGELEGFTIVPGSVGTDNVLVGAKEAMSVFELPGVPIRVDALAVHNGALDAALYGYYATIVEHSAGLSLKHTTPA